MRRALLGVLVAACFIAICVVRAEAANDIRISQVYGGGGSSAPGPAYHRDYVELFNAGSVAVDISGWAIEYASPTGTWGSLLTNIFTFPPGTVMQPCHYLLIAAPSTNSSGTSFTGSPLPVTPDFDGVAFPSPAGPQLAMGAINGKVALFSEPNISVACGSEVGLIDKVAYGTSNCAEGVAAGALTNASGEVRRGGGYTDTDDNAMDFVVTTPPVPHNSTSPGPAAPTVTAGSKSTTVLQGNSTGFSVFATGTDLTYTWRKDAVAIPGGPNTRTITLNNVQPTDAGAYDAVVCNSCGCVTSPAMTLQVCPGAASVPAVVLAVIGDPSVSVPATVTGASSMQWIANKVSLTDGAKYSGTTTSTLTLTNPASSDAGWYQLFMLGACGQKVLSNVCYLAVVTDSSVVTIVTHPSDQTVTLGSPASFNIFVAGGGTPTYLWQRWDVASKTWVKLPGATTSSYSIPAVGSGDFGSYRCVVTASNGSSVISNTANLNALAPSFRDVGSKSNVCDGAMVYWATNVPTTAVVKYGPDCRSLTNTTTGSPLGYSASALVQSPGASFVMYQVVATTPENARVVSPCAAAYFSSPPGNLSVQLWGVSYYGDLYATQDGIPVRILLSNAGCAPLPGPFTLVSLSMNGTPPRLSDHSIDLPRDLLVPGLAPGETREVEGVMFSRSDVGLPSRSTATVSGVIEYGTGQQVNVSARIYLP